MQKISGHDQNQGWHKKTSQKNSPRKTIYKTHLSVLWGGGCTIVFLFRIFLFLTLMFTLLIIIFQEMRSTIIDSDCYVVWITKTNTFIHLLYDDWFTLWSLIRILFEYYSEKKLLNYSSSSPGHEEVVVLRMFPLYSVASI